MTRSASRASGFKMISIALLVIGSILLLAGRSMGAKLNAQTDYEDHDRRGQPYQAACP